MASHVGRLPLRAMSDEPQIVARATELDAAMIRGALAGAGIRTMMSPDSVGRSGESSWKIFVPASQVAEARQLLASINSSEPQDADQQAHRHKRFGVVQSLEMMFGIDHDADPPADPFGRAGS